MKGHRGVWQGVRLDRRGRVDGEVSVEPAGRRSCSNTHVHGVQFPLGALSPD